MLTIAELLRILGVGQPAIGAHVCVEADGGNRILVATSAYVDEDGDLMLVAGDLP